MSLLRTSVVKLRLASKAFSDSFAESVRLVVQHFRVVAVCSVLVVGCAKGIDPEGPILEGGAAFDFDGAFPDDPDATSGSGGTFGGQGGFVQAGGQATSSGGVSRAGGSASGGTNATGGVGSASGGTASEEGGISPGTGGMPSSSDGGSPPVPTGDLAVQYRTTDDAANNIMRPQISVVNRGATPVALSDISVRYWYTVDGTPSGSAYQELTVDYADITRITNGSTSVTLSFARAAAEEPGADHYVEIGFDGPDSLDAGQSTNQIELRINWAGYTTDYDETNDYSWDGTKTNFADWQKVTLYVSGVLSWGVEPDGSVPTL